MPEAILGIPACYHDSTPALAANREIVAATHEERSPCKKHDPSIPIRALASVLEKAGVKLGALPAVAFYAMPCLELEHRLETRHSFAPLWTANFPASHSRQDQGKACHAAEAAWRIKSTVALASYL